MTDWFSSNEDFLWLLGIIIVFFVFFIWNTTRLKKNRTKQKERNFRKRYMERKNENIK